MKFSEEPSKVGENEKETNEEEHSQILAQHPEHEKGQMKKNVSATSLMESGLIIRQQVLCIIGQSVHFLVIKSVAKGMEWQILNTKVGVGKLRGWFLRFNGTDLLERLRGKRVIFAGDSLNRNQWESIAFLLYSAIPIPSSQAYINVKSNAYKVLRAKVK